MPSSTPGTGPCGGTCGVCGKGHCTEDLGDHSGFHYAGGPGNCHHAWEVKRRKA